MKSGTRHFFFVQLRPKNERDWHDARDSRGDEIHFRRRNDAEDYAVRLRRQRPDVETEVIERASADPSYLEPSRPAPRRRFRWW
jgi:hypothetical protein